MSRRKKKKNGCGCFFTTLLILVLVAVILISSGTLSKLVTYVEKQLYPLSFEDQIFAAAEMYNLEPEFICAVIHTESRFVPTATSSVGAQGLMQIMPETFLWLSDIRSEEHTAEGILTPEVNIDYGCYYMRYLTDEYGDEYTAAAAYNAGNVVKEWLSDPDYSSDGITLHSIPYPETSGYIEKIHRAEEMYQKLYFDE